MITNQNDQYKFNELYDNLKRLLMQFETLSFSSRAYFAEIPPITDDDLKDIQLGVDSLHYKLTNHFGEQARTLALEALKQFERDNETISGRFSLKAPGVLLCQNTQVAMEMAEEINALKRQLQHCVQDRYYDELTQSYRHRRSAYQKHRFLHLCKPNVISYQLYRKVQVIDAKNFHTLRFYWIGKNADKQINKNQAEKRLIDYYETRMGSENEASLKVARNTLQCIPTQAKIYHRYSRNDTVMVSAYLKKPVGKKYSVTFDAHLPFIFINADPDLRIEPLMQHEPTKPVERKREAHFIDERAEIYVTVDS